MSNCILISHKNKNMSMNLNKEKKKFLIYVHVSMSYIENEGCEYLHLMGMEWVYVGQSISSDIF